MNTSKNQSNQAPKASEASTVIVTGKVFHAIPEDLFIPPDALEVILESFEGPLDLLLYLIRKQNLDILDIPVAKITQQYVEYVEVMHTLKLDLAAEYLVMAAMLAQIKSRMLLPRSVDSDEEDTEDPKLVLIRRLQEYERYRQAAASLDDLPRLERDLFCSQVDLMDTEQVIVLPQVHLNALVKAYELAVDKAKRNEHWVIGREVLSVRERMTTILEKLQKCDYLLLEAMFDPKEGRMGLVVSFIAILEMVKDKILILVQNEHYSPIHVKIITPTTDIIRYDR